jgi:adenylate cyclase
LSPATAAHPDPAARDESAGLSRRTAAIASLAVWLLVSALATTAPWRNVEWIGFDALSTATAPGRSSYPITLVAIDEASFQNIGLRWPWPRSLHARLIDQLAKSGALVVALDIMLPEASEPAEDQALAEAIARNGQVVLAADMAYQESAQARQWLRVDPLPAFLEAGARSGLANITLDPDLVVRQMPEGRDVFWREIVRRAAVQMPGVILEPQSLAGSLIRYVGPDHTFPYVSYYQAIEADKLLPPDAFKDQIVIIGRDVKSSTDVGAAQAESFATPFTARTGWLTPGAEIHANILETAIGSLSIQPAPAFAPPVVAFVAVAAAALALRRWRPLLGGVVVAVLAALLVALSAGLFVGFRLWLPVFSSMLGVAGVYTLFGSIAYLGEQRRRAEVRRAFAMYVAPEVVDEMLAHPERLRLGGERREITALFTDLKGFTTLSEKLGAEQVAGVLSEHFTRMTAIIKSHKGTVTNFIGDAVMAIWGAPVEDPEHARRACLAALDMQRDVARHREELRARGLPEISMRVGIHTCQAVVGNLGGEERFSYTAIGDGVNLASRLEGVNKLYGTPILVSGETASQLGKGLALRPVDRVVVKGKTEPVEILTPEEDPQVREITREAIEAYRRRDWDASEAAWARVAEHRPEDGVAKAYRARIAELRGEPPPADWNGSISLDKL